MVYGYSQRNRLESHTVKGDRIGGLGYQSLLQATERSDDTRCILKRLNENFVSKRLERNSLGPEMSKPLYKYQVPFVRYYEC